MKNLKKRLKVLGYILLIVIGSLGSSFGAPIPPPIKKEDTIEVLVESVELNDDDTYQM